MALSVSVGEARVTVFNTGHLQADLDDWLRLLPPAWSPRYTALFEQPFAVPIQCVHIQSGPASVLVDAPQYDLPPPGLMLPDYRPPPGLAAQLWEAGISPGAVEHVVITHLHFDHYGAVATQQGKRYAPAFANARYHIGRADWERPQTQRAMRRRNSEDARTLGVLEAGKVVDLVSASRELAAGITILPAPGETAGHLVVRVHSAGETLYCVGDLFHHPVEIERPEWGPHWADHAALLASRRSLIDAALAEEALLVATHIPGLGRFEPTAEGVRWVEVESTDQADHTRSPTTGDGPRPTPSGFTDQQIHN
mgnify:CR=1 FL=1